MTDLFDAPDDATPLAPDECRGLLLSAIAFRHELNRAEPDNIRRAQEWPLSRRRPLLSEPFVRQRHPQMFGDVWRWAGAFRTTERNIGIPFYEIPVALRQLLADAEAWITHAVYSPDEAAVRVHHRLVQIHPFPNGNGRHARLLADLLVMHLGGARFTWGSARLEDAGEVRRRYIEALRAADQHDLAPLVAFARS